MWFVYDYDSHLMGVENEFERKANNLSVNLTVIKVELRFKQKPNLLH